MFNSREEQRNGVSSQSLRNQQPFRRRLVRPPFRHTALSRQCCFLMVASPIGVPFIRKMPGKTSFGWRARLAYLTNCESIFREAYQNVRGHQYTKNGQAVVVPGFGVRNELILPGSSMRWAMKQPETVLSIAEAHVEFDQADYSLGHSKYIRRMARLAGEDRTKCHL
ncbi:hypothetical protein BJX66DRAFT_264709 [Aspergillus keveii]|uniref:Uncharacterized protein n=1 Tax=Aspergillus keveii TaxID=714993 RepID=A0ABR4FY40_9EURO